MQSTNNKTEQTNHKQIAEQATIQSFLNCYLRETGKFKKLDSSSSLTAQILAKTNAKEVICCPLSFQKLEIIAGVRYWSLTDRHLFAFPLFYKSLGSNQLLKLDYVTLAALITKELSLNADLSADGSEGQSELMLGVIQSCQNIEQFVRERSPDIASLYSFRSTFGETEQALIFGHHLHPNPKSRQGFLDQELPIYAPECKGKFALYYFRAHNSIVVEGSTLAKSTTELIKSELWTDAMVSEEFKNTYCATDDYSLIPVHPWQAAWLKHSPKVQQLLEQGLLQDLGQHGKDYLPTSSIRTVYNAESDFMFKLSLNVKITNSVRGNLYKELERGLEVSRILEGEIGKNLRDRFPNFDIIRDPAFITIPLEAKESGFATILRANPFKQESAVLPISPQSINATNANTNANTDATCLIALCQDAITGEGSRLAQIIQTLAEQENRSSQEVSLDWFNRYLTVSVKPILWLYFTYGIAVEAHQQNSVLQLQAGYPQRFFYRDNQGYYYRRSMHALLNTILPGIGEKSETICEDAVVDERLIYYLFINNIFGLINAFGVAELVDERSLIDQLRSVLAEFADTLTTGSLLLELLHQPTLKGKANLFTRFHNLDELVGPVATQSVYVETNNPLYTRELARQGGIYA
jgi:siderophore synthetase component